MAEQAGRVAYAHGDRVHERAARALRRGARAAPAARRPGDLPGRRRLGGDGVGAQAGPRLPRRPRRDRALDRHRALGELPRQHARRAGPVGPQAAAPAVRGVARAIPARLGRLPVPRRRARRERPRRRRRAGGGAGARDRGRRSRDGRGVRRRADRRRDARRRGAARRLLAGDRRGLPPARRAAHRRRGDDRLRADGPLVRRGPLGRPAGHPRRGEGRDVRLLPVRARGGVRRRSRCRPRRPAGSSTASRTRTTPSARRSPAEVLRILEDEHLVEASAAKGDRLQGAPRSIGSAAIRTSARSAAAACCSAWSSSRIARRARRSRARSG